MRSIGIDPGQWSERGLLHLLAERPSRFGLEAHLAAMYRAIDELSPETVVVDSITGYPDRADRDQRSRHRH